MLSIIAFAALAFSTASGWEGNYMVGNNFGQLDVEIHRTHYGRLRVNISVVAKDGCVGELEYLTPVPPNQQLDLIPQDREPFSERTDGDRCALTINKVGANMLIVTEHECQMEHGAACTFEGRPHRVN
jgi:hypothetical protein